MKKTETKMMWSSRGMGTLGGRGGVNMAENSSGWEEGPCEETPLSGPVDGEQESAQGGDTTREIGLVPVRPQTTCKGIYRVCMVCSITPHQLESVSLLPSTGCEVLSSPCTRIQGLSRPGHLPHISSQPPCGHPNKEPR